MKVFVTSIGESTTDLCMWSLERLGFNPILIQSSSTLWDKSVEIYKNNDEDILRVDADVIVNKNILELVKLDELWWYQSLTYDWFKQDITNGGVQFIRKPAIKYILNKLMEAKYQERPDSYLFRLEEFHNPRRCGTFNKICGLTGYKQNDVQRVKDTKARRKQTENYDFELAERIEAL